MCLMSPRGPLQLQQTGKGCWDIGDGWVKVHPPISVFGLILCSLVFLFFFSFLTSSVFLLLFFYFYFFFFLPLFHPLLATYFRVEDVSTEERNPPLRVNGTVCWLTSLGLFGLSELRHLTKVWFLDTLQGRLRYMSLVVTEVMLTMGRWLRGDWRVFTALLLKGSNLESSNSTCKEGKMLKQ